MSVLLLHYRTAWNDYFSTTNPTNLNSQTYNSRQTPSDSSVYVSNCLFNSIVESNQGGALYCSSSVTYFLVESTSFFSCKTSGGYGGAIYFSNTNNGQSVLHEVCGYDCCSTSNTNYHFAYIRIYNDASSKNYANYSSITRCVNEISSSEWILYLGYGKICCPSINSSMNKCYCVPGIYCAPLSLSNSVTCSLTYSSFADNAANSLVCIYLWMSGANFEMKSCNIIRNTQGSTSSYGTILTDGNVMIENSCILENRAPYIFYQSSYSCTITVSKCTLDKTTYNQNLIIQNTVTKSFILALNHMFTRNCNAKYDYIGILTPIAQSPSSSNKQKLYCSCDKLLYQLQASFVSLSSLLIILFINFGVSGDL
jgi:hypothetical protein